MKPITTAAEAEQAIDDLTGLIDQLTGLVEQETSLMHAGRIRNAAALERSKAELASQLYVSGERVKGHAKFLQQTAPARCVALVRKQEAFRGLLQKNMIVLATAHAVSEGIMRRLSGDLARKSTPQTYGASGRAAAPHPKYGQPLAVSKKL